MRKKDKKQVVGDPVQQMEGGAGWGEGGEGGCHTITLYTPGSYLLTLQESYAFILCLCVSFSVFWCIPVAAPPTGRVHALVLAPAQRFGSASESPSPAVMWRDDWLLLSRVGPGSGEEELGPPYVTGSKRFVVKEVAVA